MFPGKFSGIVPIEVFTRHVMASKEEQRENAKSSGCVCRRAEMGRGQLYYVKPWRLNSIDRQSVSRHDLAKHNSR